MKKFYYSLLAFPLSCLGIPLYIHLASYYYNSFNVSLSLIASTIFICRIFDCIFDPLAGSLSDYLINKNIKRVNIILIAAIPVFINFYFLFNPPSINKEVLIYSLCTNLLILYFFLSFVIVNYEAMVCEFEEQSKFIAARELMQIVGILIISILPSIIAKYYQISYDQSLSFVWLFIIPFLILALVFLRLLNNSDYIYNSKQEDSISKKYYSLKNIKDYGYLFLTYFFNSIAVSIPAVAIRFYVDFHLNAQEKNGYFLGLYFLSAAISVFIWTNIIKKIGAKKSWQISILFSISIFIFAIFLNERNYHLFYLICLLSGFAVGCDLTAPQLILIDKIAFRKNKTSYFAIFSLITKISLAFATFLTLNLISKNNIINYAAIPIVYALLPCLFKILTFFFLKKL